MATTEFERLATPGTGENLRTLIETGGAHLARLWTALKNRRAAARLLSWDNRMLGDIGLTRGDVESAFSSGLADDPSFVLTEFRRERRAARRRA